MAQGRPGSRSSSPAAPSRSYEAGAALVELAALADARLVPEAIAAALDIRALPAQDVVEAVIDVLAARTLLLVLDNCEHVLAATAALSDRLLRFAPQLTIVATSREPLRVAGEVVFRVPSLDIPSPDRPLPPDQLLEYESVSLFVDRAAASSPGFELDAENAEDVARICFRLDGLPLALELAAGRVGVLSPAAIAERLDDRFRLLRSGSHAAPTRQQTLTATLQWSHDLLEPDEQVLFRRLAIFAGGFELEAVEEVCDGDGLEAAEVADVLARLAEKSLVAVEEGLGSDGTGCSKRFACMHASGLPMPRRRPRSRRRHAGGRSRWPSASSGSAQLDRETPNLRAALDTLLVHAPHDALRLCVALLPFWLRRIELGEARRRFAAALEACPERTTLGAEALLAAAAIDFRSGTLSAGMSLAERSRAVASEIGDAHREWRALQFLGEFGIAGDAAEVALPWLEQALALARRERFAASEAISIHSLGVAAWIAGDLPQTDDLIAREHRVVPLARGVDRHDSVPAEHRGDPAEPTGRANRACDTCSKTRCSRSSRSPARRRRATHWRTRPQSPAFGEISRERGRCWTRAKPASRPRGTTPASPRCSSAAPTPRSPRGTSLQHTRTSSGPSSCGPGWVTGAGAGSSSPGSAWSRRSRATTPAPSATSPRLATSSGGPATAGASPARCGAPPTWRSRAAGSTMQRPPCARRSRCWAQTQRERWLASTVAGLAEVAVLRGDTEQAAELLRDARERYASRDDALGVATIDERLRSLAKEPLRAGKGSPDTPVRQAKTKGRKS